MYFEASHVAMAHVSGLAKMDELDLEEADAWHLTAYGPHIVTNCGRSENQLGCGDITNYH